MQRKIIHIDMDYFFAQVEEKDNHKLKDKPFSVGSTSEHRGVISTCNYIARNYGVHSAMSVRNALQTCPNLILLPVRMAKYKAVSSVIRSVFYTVTDQVEALSLDEAYIDVTQVKMFSNSATLIAKWIQKEIYRKTGLTSSTGVAENKLLAKIASDINKPNGIKVVTPQDTEAFIANMAVKKLPGVGKVTHQKMQEMGVNYCRDLRRYDQETLVSLFGKFGQSLYLYCRGQDNRKIAPERPAKSISVEQTYHQDLTTLNACYKEIDILYKSLLKRIQKSQYINRIFIKTTDCYFKKHSIERKSDDYKLNYYQILLQTLYQEHHHPIRLIGLGVRISQHQNKQLSLNFTPKQ